MKRLDNKIALITGASSGIGNIIARKYLEEGAHIIAVGRDLKKLEELDDYAKFCNSSTTIVRLDLREGSKIFTLAKEIAQKFSKLDILMLNAAILGEIAPLEYYDPNVWNQVIAVNLNANFYLLRTLTPLIKQSVAGHIIFVSCNMSNKNNAYWGAYSVSKAALEKLAKVCEEENKTNNIKTHFITPAPVDTNLRKTAFRGITVGKVNNHCEIEHLFLKNIFTQT